MSELTEIFAEGPWSIWTGLMVRLNGNVHHDARLVFDFARAGDGTGRCRP
jgi:hypothetical protein